MRHNHHVAIILLTVGHAVTLTFGRLQGDQVELTRIQVLNGQGYNVLTSQLGTAKIKAVNVQNAFGINVGNPETLSEMLAQLEERTQELKFMDDNLRLDPELEDLIVRVPAEGRRLWEIQLRGGTVDRHAMEAYEKIRIRLDELAPEFEKSSREFKYVYTMYLIERETVVEAGGVLPEEVILWNAKLRPYRVIIRSHPTSVGEVAAIVLVAIAAALLIYYESTLSHLVRTEPVDENHIQVTFSPAALMKEGCTELQLSAAKVEGITQGEMSVKKYYALLNELSPVYHEGYQVASRAAAEYLAVQPITSWGNATAAPLDPIIPHGATDAEKHKLELKHAEAHKNWAVNKFMKPIHSQFQFAQKYHEDIHEAAFHYMRNSTALSFAVNSDDFNIAYTAMYARYNILSECSPYVHEDKMTAAWFKEGRMKQAVLLANSTAALDLHFAAKSALSAPDTSFDPLSFE